MTSSPLIFLSFSLFISLLSLSSPTPQHHFLPLTHSLSKSHFTSSHHLLSSTSTTSASRHSSRTTIHHHHHRHSLPLSISSDYTLTFSLNSQTISVFMDTGSDVVWFPCSPFDCILCEGKYKPRTLNPLNLTNSSLLPCKSRACSAVHHSLPLSDLCAMANCPLEDIEVSDCANHPCPPFYYAYGDGSFIAKLHTFDLIIPSKKPLIFKNFTFGCSHSALGEPIGVAGFGPGPISLPAQLAQFSPDLGTQFSYCLVSHSFHPTKLRHPSPLILGKFKDVQKFAYTPLLDNPKYPYFYTVGLEGISIGSTRISAPEFLTRIDGDGNGGVIVDSGTTYTILPTELFNSVVGELDRRVKRVSEIESRRCYYLGESNIGLLIPNLVLHFGGNSSVVLPRKNYVHEFMDGGHGMKKGRRIGCLMMMDGGDDSYEGPGATLGNYLQQGFHVVYDLEMGRVGFAPRKCASLWKSLNSN